MVSCLVWYGVLLTITSIHAFAIDNYIEGGPQVECGATTIAINFNVTHEFAGHIYVKVDRAFRIQCFYVEGDTSVTQDIQVSDLTPSLETVVVPMPVCKYEILEGGPEGEPIHFGLIGQQVYHKWTCESETRDAWCMVVHSCTVDDGNGDTLQIMDTNGCALDRYVLNNLEYATDLIAGQEAYVYKYADRAGLFYQCQISVTAKEPNNECARPRCSEPTGFNAVSVGGGRPKLDEAGHGDTVSALPTSTTEAAGGRERGSRHGGKREVRGPGERILDVRAEMTTIDLAHNDKLRAKIERDMANLTRASAAASGSAHHPHEISGVCVSPFLFALLLTPAFLGLLVIFVVVVVKNRHDAKKGAMTE